MTHICVSKRTIIDSDNGLSPDRRQAIIWTNAGLLLFGPLGTNFSEILIGILTFSFKKMRLKVSSAKRRPFCLGLNVLIHISEKEPSFDRINKCQESPSWMVTHTYIPTHTLSWTCRLSLLLVSAVTISCPIISFIMHVYKIRQKAGFGVVIIS